MVREVVRESCAGLDVHKKIVVACLLRTGADGSVVQEERSFSTMTGQLEALVAWLTDRGCTHVALEATGVYWKPVYNVLEERFQVLVVNPLHIKAVAGRKTDKKDAERLAQLLRYDRLDGSFIPTREYREKRELTRARAALIAERARVVQRLQKTLEGANIKLDLVVTDLLGVSGQRILDALVAGDTDPAALADLAHWRVQKKRPALEQALVGKLTGPLRFLIQQHLAHWRELDARIAAFDAEIAAVLLPFAETLTRLRTIPGIGPRTAEVIWVEVGHAIDRFPSDRHLAAWAGVAPGNKESGGKVQRAPIRHGNPWLKAALVEAAWASARCKDGYLPAQFRRLAARRGRKRALVAVAHSLLTIVYQMLRQGTDYQDLGSTFFEERQRVAVERRALQQLERLGYDVQLTRRSASPPAQDVA
jgi:transposase